MAIEWAVAAPIFVVLLAVVNLKVLPFAWHVRLLRAILWPFLLAPKTYEGENDSMRLFRPIVSESRSPLFECDFNMHKSNSSYYTDLDIARANIIAVLFGGGLRQLPRVAPPGLPLNAITLPVLGGTSCHFHRELAPYQLYRMETQVLWWDQKWMYILTRFRGTKADQVYATAVMKVVFKAGRVTVAPGLVVQAAGLLPDIANTSWQTARQQGSETAKMYGSVA